MSGSREIQGGSFQYVHKKYIRMKCAYNVIVFRAKKKENKQFFNKNSTFFFFQNSNFVRKRPDRWPVRNARARVCVYTTGQTL